MISNKKFNSRTTKVKVSAGSYYRYGSNKEPAYIYFYFYITVKNGGRGLKVPVGYINLTWIDNNKYETHSSIHDDKHRGKGLGLFMYTTAMDWAAKRGLTVTSYDREYQSPCAKRLWKSSRLREKYFVRKSPKDNRWLVTPKKVTFKLPQIIKDVKL